jgi:putative lipoic acid-binding regulatory protein
MADTHIIEFPCDYPIKVIGDADPDSIAEVLMIVRRHAPEVTPDQINTRQSSRGNYHSIRVTIVATGEQQLKALHEELMALQAVRMVL